MSPTSVRTKHSACEVGIILRISEGPASATTNNRSSAQVYHPPLPDSPKFASSAGIRERSNIKPRGGENQFEKDTEITFPSVRFKNSQSTLSLPVTTKSSSSDWVVSLPEHIW